MADDLIVVGGGLSGSLMAWRLAQQVPNLRLRLLERGETLGGNHSWSFYDSDLTPAQREWMAPLVQHHWDGYEVRFPDYRRSVSTGYNCISSQRLHDVISRTLGGKVVLNADVVEMTATTVRLRDGSIFSAGAVVDARGAGPSAHLKTVYQKFVGHELRLREPHGLTQPVIMDATVPQGDDFRFFYTLPFGPDTLLVEDTRYSDTGELDVEAMRGEIRDYAIQQGWKPAELRREETGVLPITLGFRFNRFWREKPEGVVQAGLGAALFHPTTGYSLPDAVRLADATLAGWPLQGAQMNRMVRQLARQAFRRQRFFRTLNRMLFLAGAGGARYRVLQRFYRLPQKLIERFYYGKLNMTDKLRILTGKPPVPVLGALRALPESACWRHGA